MSPQLQEAIKQAFAADEPPYAKLSEAEIADKLGRVKAELAPLAIEEEELVNELKRRGAKRYLGMFYEANVFKTHREILIAEKVRKYLHPNQLRHCIKKIDSLTCVVSARGVRR